MGVEGAIDAGLAGRRRVDPVAADGRVVPAVEGVAGRLGVVEAVVIAGDDAVRRIAVLIDEGELGGEERPVGGEGQVLAVWVGRARGDLDVLIGEPAVEGVARPGRLGRWGEEGGEGPVLGGLRLRRLVHR